MALVFPVSGIPQEVAPENEREFSLLEIRKWVEDVKGDGIDAVKVSRMMVMFVRENSFWELPVNRLATDFIKLHRPDYLWELHGPVLLCDLVESGDSDEY